MSDRQLWQGTWLAEPVCLISWTELLWLSARWLQGTNGWNMFAQHHVSRPLIYSPNARTIAVVGVAGMGVDSISLRDRDASRD
jgi:hypothetical protein